MALVLNGNGTVTGLSDISTDLVSTGDISAVDATLSGGVYVGGTGSANYLDDYEEGTFTPAYTPNSGSFSTITYSSQGGSYVKVGNVVHIQLRLRTSDLVVGTASQYLQITGLPFTSASSSTTGRNAISMSNVLTWGTKQPMNGYVESNTTMIVLQYRDAIDGNDNTFDTSQMSFGSGLKNSIFISATYLID